MRATGHPLRESAVSCALVVSAVLAGCGESGSQRLPVTGRINGSGAETLDGAISFIPAQGNEGLGATCALKSGAYRFDRSNGPSAGHYEVSIRRTPSKAAISKAAMSKAAGRLEASHTRQEWIFQAEVLAAGPYTIDFDLK